MINENLILTLFLFVFPVHIVAQDSYPADKPVETAAIALQRAMIQAKTNLSSGDFMAHVDTLEKYLYPTLVEMNLISLYLGQLSLNAFYAVTGNPKINYEDIEKALEVTRKIEVFHSMAYIDCAVALGDYYHRNQQAAEALTMYQEGLRVMQKILEIPTSDEYFLRKKIAVFHFMQKDYLAFVTMQEDVVSLTDALTGISSEMTITELGFLANGYTFVNQYEKADSCYSACRRFYEQTGQTEQLLSVLLGQANTKRILLQQEEAIDLYKEILNYISPESPEYPEILYEMAFCFREKGDMQQCLQIADQLMDVVRHDPEVHFEMLYRLMKLYKLVNAMDQAKEIAGLLTFEPTGNDPVVLSRMGYIHAVNGDYHTAHMYIDSARNSVDLYLTVGKIVPGDNILDEFIQALQAIGNYKSAVDYYTKNWELTITLLEETHPIPVQMMGVLAEMYMLTGDNEGANTILQKTLKLAGETDTRLYISNKQGNLYFTTGLYSQAMDVYSQLLPLTTNPVELFNLYQNLTGCYVSQADLLRAEYKEAEAVAHSKEAEKYALLALETAKTQIGVNGSEYVTALNQMAMICILNGMNEQALVYAGQCREAIEKNLQADDLTRALQLGGVGNGICGNR